MAVARIPRAAKNEKKIFNEVVNGSVSLLQDCTLRNEAEMTCPVPLIDLPSELITANSSSSEDDSAAPRSRRRRHADTEDSGGWPLLGRLWNLVRTGSWFWSGYTPSHRLSRQKRAPVASIRNKNVSMSLYLGFIMDKLTSLRNISKTKPNIRIELIPFNFHCDQTPATFDPAVNPLIKIKVIIFQLYFSLFGFLPIVFVLTSLCTNISTSMPKYFF